MKVRYTLDGYTTVT